MNSQVNVSRQSFAGDAWGGLAAMLVALPSAIAFGVTIFSPLGGALAAQGALAGILGATALGLVSPAFGGSARLITAPCAPAAAVLSALAITYTQQGMAPGVVLIMLALIGLLAGLVQIGLGLAGIGRLIKYIPFPVVSGYLSGVGLIIIGSQVPKWLGAPAGSSFLNALASPLAWGWQSMVVGGVVMLAMVFTSRLTQTIPAAILALLAGVMTYLGLALAGFAAFETVNNPMLVGTLAGADGDLGASMRQHWQSITALGLESVAMVLVPALTLAVLLSIDTLKTCVVIDAMTNTQHDSNRELVGQGLGNIASAMVGGIPGAGTMGASMINISSGGTTRRSGVLAGVFSLAAFLVLAPLIAWVPIAALAGILIVVGFRMIDRRSLSFFFSRATRLDFVVIVAVILVALFGNLIAASGVGVALAILLFIREQTRSSVVRNRIEGQDIFRNHPLVGRELEQLEREGGETVVFELQGSLFFGTANQLYRALEPETAARKYVILSMRRVQSLDVTATHVLEQIKDRLEEKDAYLVFCDIPKGLPSGLKMKRFLKETGVVRPTNKAFAFRQLDDALEWVAERELAELPPDDVIAPVVELPDMPLFAGQPPESIDVLATLLEKRHIKAGKKVFKAGSGNQELFIIRQGLVKTSLTMGKKDNYHLATNGPGELLGGMGFIATGGHLADALALTETEVYALSREHFEALRQSHSDLALVLLDAVAKNLVDRLSATMTELQGLRS